MSPNLGGLWAGKYIGLRAYFSKSPLKMCLERELGGTCSQLCIKQHPYPVNQHAFRRNNGRFKVDQSGLNRGNARVHITLPLNDPVRLERRIKGVRRLTSSSSSSSNTADYDVSCFCLGIWIDLPLSPCCVSSKIIDMRRGRDEVDSGGGKHVKHSLAIIPLPFNPEEIGLSVQACGELAIIKTGESPKKRAALVVVRTRRRLMMWCRRRQTQCLLVRQKVEV
ncbi:hypothetical protein ACLB2K_077383 [Fragaria x ananassa]